jgi:16S rRNA (adenine1518-N6/adenine1519-N6)-dimethyltransferase
MSVQETKQLLREHRISPNKLLGQSFMVEVSLFPKLSDYASLSEADVVLDVGAGFGFLTRFLASKCKAVVAVEKDPHVAEVLREQVRGVCNVTVVEGDVLKAALPAFNKVVSIPPYYLSSRLVMWLLERKVELAVLILQREFAGRLVAAVGSEEYGWLTVLAGYSTEVEVFEPVPRGMFYPQPEVDSVVVRLKLWKSAPFRVNDAAFFERMVRWLFTQRNRKLGNALKSLVKGGVKAPKGDAEELAGSLPFRDRRVRELSPKDFGALANALAD